MAETVHESSQQAGRGRSKLWIVIGIILALGFVVVVGFVIVFASRMGWIGGGSDIIIGYRDSDFNFDLFLVEMGKPEDEGVQLGEEVSVGDSMIFVYQENDITRIIQGAGFAPDSPYIFLTYQDDEVVFEQMRTNGEKPDDLFSSEDFPVVSVFPEQKRVLIADYSEGGASCYAASFGEEADRLEKATDCLVVPDGKTIVVVEQDEAEYTFTAVDASTGDENRFLVVEGPLEMYQVSNDASMMGYVVDNDGEQELHLVDIKKEEDEILAEGSGIAAFRFAREGTDFFYMVEDDEGILSLFVNDEADAVAEGMQMAAQFTQKADYLIYSAGEDFDELVILSYSISDKESEEIIDGEKLEFGVTADPEQVIISEHGDDGDVTFYSSRIDGKGLEEILEASEVDFYQIWSVPGHDFIYFLLTTQDGVSVFGYPFGGEGFFIVEDWAQAYLLNVSPNGKQLAFSGQEEEGDDLILYAFELDDGNDPAALDDDVLWIANAVFTSNNREVLYTAGSGDDYDEVDVRLAPLADGKPERLYKKAQLFDVEWGAVEPFWPLTFEFLLSGESYCPGAILLSPDNPVEASIGEDEVVCFRFSAGAKEVWNLDVDSVGIDQDLEATLLDREGNYVSYNDDGIYDYNPWLAYKFELSGVYYVEIRDISGVAGDFTIRLLESEDSRAGAEEIALEEFVSGTITEDSFLYLVSPDIGEEPVGGILGKMFKIELEQSTQVDFYINGDSNYEFAMALFDNDGFVVEEEDSDQGFGEAMLSAPVLAPGPYYLIAIVLVEDGEPDSLDVDFELFSAIGSASMGGTGEINFDEQAFGTLENGVHDEWAFFGSEGYTVIITMESSDFDAYLELYDPSGYLVVFDDDSGGNRNAQIEYTLGTTGYFTIYARSYEDSGSGGYSLYLEQILMEPEEPVGGGGEIEIGETVSAYLMDGAGDSWEFYGTSGTEISLVLASDDFECVVQLLDPSGFEVGYDYSAGDGRAQIEDYTLESSGYFTIIARGYGDSGSGDYTLSLTAKEAPVTSEGIIEIGEFVFGDLAIGAEDYWYFEAEAGDMITIALESDEFDAYLELLDEEGDELAHNDDGGLDGNAMIWGLIIPETGEYQIIARAYDDAEGGEYILTLDYDSFIVTGELDYGDSIIAQIAPGDRMVWSFDGYSGDLVTISMESDDFDTYIELRDEDGNILTADDDSGEVGTNSLIESFALPESGTYLIVAVGYQNTSEGDFVLSLSKE